MIVGSLARPPASAPRPVSTDGKKRFFDNSLGAWVVKLLPGEFYVSQQPDEVIVTILGSCVSACIRDPLAGIGGMNHFMLPEGGKQSWNGESESARYGNFAMEKLVNELLKAGCSRSSLEVKVFGGANVIRSQTAVGSDNSEFILEYLKAEGLRCSVHDLGSHFPRRIHYYPVSGRVVRRFLNNGAVSDIASEERNYARRLSSQNDAGDIELFA
jgi:chemotaxis protein CheD